MATGLLSLWMLVHLLATVPQLHHQLHPEDSSPDHHCLLTEFASGSFESAPVYEASLVLGGFMGWQPAPVLEVPALGVFTPALAPRPPPSIFQSFSRAGF
jgi:hypothetical protein